MRYNDLYSIKNSILNILGWREQQSREKQEATYEQF